MTTSSTQDLLNALSALSLPTSPVAALQQPLLSTHVTPILTSSVPSFTSSSSSTVNGVETYQIPIELLETFLSLSLPKLEGEISPATINEIKARWQQLFTFATKFRSVVQELADGMGVNLISKDIPISNTIKNTVHSLLDTGELGNLKVLLRSIGLIITEVKSK